MSDLRLKATCYYPHPIKALTGKPGGKVYKGWGERLRIKTEGDGELVVRVDPKDHYLAAVEASATLDLTAIGAEKCKLGISYYSKAWHALPYAPHGVGTRLNPLQPGRDFAHGHRKGWPFGTRLQVTEAPPELDGRIRSTLYRGCAFGSKSKDDPDQRHRVDLFVAEPCDFFGWIKGRITKPWTDNGKLSHRPTKGGQQCLNRLGYQGANGRRLAEDDMIGRNTRHALAAFLRDHKARFPDGLPSTHTLADSELFFVLREVAKEQKS